MPSFGLSEALKSAVEASRVAKVVRPAEAELNAAAADRSFASKGVAPAAPDLKPAPMDAADAGPVPKVSIPADVSPGADTPIEGTPVPTEADAAAGPEAVAATPDQAADASLGGEPARGDVAASAEATDTAPKAETPDLTEDTKVAPDDATVKPTDTDAPPANEATPKGPSDLETYAAKLQKANLGDFALDETHQPNFDRMTVTDDVKAAIAQIAEDNKGKIEEARRGKITNEQLAGLASDLDTNADVVKAVMARENGGVLNAETLLAARQVLNSSATRLQALASKVVAGTATDMEKIQLARQAQFHNDYQTQLMGARAEAGRALNAFNIPSGSDPATIARIAEIVNGNGSNIQKLAQALSMTDSVAGIGTIVAPGNLFQRSIGAAGNLINRIFVNGILSGPPTWGKIGVANSLFQAMNVTELAFAARIGRFLPGDEHVVAGEAMASVAGIVSGFSDAFRLGGRALIAQDTLDGVSRLNIPGAAKKDIGYYLPGVDKTAYLGSLIRGIEYTLNIPGSIIGAGDEGYKTLAYRSYATRMTFLHVQDQIATGAINAADAAQTAKDFMENLPADVQNDAEAYAHQVTFQAPLGPIGAKVSDAINAVPALKLIVPFMRTATNIFKESAMRTPLALFSNKFYAAMQEGGAARDLMVTRVAMGTATGALAASLVANDMMTGGGPTDPKARAFWEQDGRKPYSLRVTDPITKKETWATYANVEPIASVLGAVADATEIASYIHADDDVSTMTDSDTQLSQAAAGIVAGVMNNTMKKSFVEGLANFFDFANDPGRQIKHYAQQTAVSMVPFSGAARFVRNTQDPYLREAWTTMDAIRNTLPGYSEGLPLTPDVFGEPRLGKSASPIGLMSPISFSDAKEDPVVNEIKDVMTQTRQVPIGMPDKRQGGVDGVGGMRLDASMYSDLVQIARSQPIFGNGNTFKDQLHDVIESNAYQQSTPLEKADLLRKVQTDADKIGVALLERDNAQYAQAIAAWRMKANRLKFDQ